DSLGNALSAAGGKLVDNIGPLASGASVSLTIVVTAPGSPGQWFNAASVSGNETDGDLSNNTSLLATNVVPSADLSVTLSADQAKVTTGKVLTLTAAVTNRGPSTATGVALKEILPGGATVVSVVSSRGSASQAGGVVNAALGDLGVGDSATVTIAVIPGVAG